MSIVGFSLFWNNGVMLNQINKYIKKLWIDVMGVEKKICWTEEIMGENNKVGDDDV